MGVQSWYKTSINDAFTCKIRWEAMDKNKIEKCSSLKFAYETKRVETLEEFAKEYLDDSRLFGYLNEDTINGFLELNKNLIPNGCFPRLYFKIECEATYVYLEFHPGTETILYGVYDYSDLYEKALPSMKWEKEYNSKRYLELSEALEASIYASLLETDKWTVQRFVYTPDVRTAEEKTKHFDEYLKGNVKISYSKL